MTAFIGSPSVLARTLFVNHGPIVKAPMPILTGSNLLIVSPDEVLIPTGSFTSSTVGKTVTISGTPAGRNDGTFYVSAVRGPTRLRLKDANLDFSDSADIEAQVCVLANDVRQKFNFHLQAAGVHGYDDLSFLVTDPDATDTASAIVLLNSLKVSLHAHSVSFPAVHSFADPDAAVYVPLASDLNSAVILANELWRRYETHRQDRFFHLVDDSVNRVVVKPVVRTAGTGPMVGPFNWLMCDPRDGQIADDPSDVAVFVNLIQVTVDAVFGLLGAVVLSVAPGPLDSVTVDYRYMVNPPTQFSRLNSDEFLLNQEGNRGVSGLPSHRYRQRSYLVSPPKSGMSVTSPRVPLRVEWKWKGYERKYTACLNDPNTLLLNVPSNRIMYPVLSETVTETVTRYDPTTLPQNAYDPWTYTGDGTLALVAGGSELVLTDDMRTYGANAPLFTHKIDLTYESEIFAAHRLSVDPGSIIYEGCSTGVGFGFTDGQKAAVVGFVKTDALDVESAIAMVNEFAIAYGAHIASAAFHDPVDSVNVVDVAEAHDLDSLIVVANRLKTVYNAHVLTGPVVVHKNADSLNVVPIVDEAVDPVDLIALVNAIRVAFNAHLTQADVHYADDGLNFVDQVRQVGFLTSAGFLEEQSSWVAFPHDWSVETTYRVHRGASGDVGLFLSGDLFPRASVPRQSLPDTSSLDMRLDLMYQTFFGGIGDSSASVSKWKFVRVDVVPVDSVQVGRNKSVSYVPNVVPDLDPQHPWIPVGQGGTEYLVSPTKLVLDSTASIPDAVATSSGLVTGEYKGFLRVEPSLSSRTTVSFEFRVDSPMFSSGIDNKSLGVHIGDGTFATQLCFLQSNPIAATVPGIVHEPFPVVSGDTAVFLINGIRYFFTAVSSLTTVSALSAALNGLVGYAAFGPTVAYPDVIQVTSPTTGSSSSVTIIDGSVFRKVGIPVGPFFGSDSLPESKLSWVGTDLPDLVSPSWSTSGVQLSEMMERTMRVTDRSSVDFRSYTMAERSVTSSVVSASSDWKADFRESVLSYVPGDPVVSGPNLMFCGSVMNVDEGPDGKCVEMHLSVDASDVPCVGVYTYDSMSDSLVYVTHYPFSWTDGARHSYSLYTNKTADLVFLVIDGSSMMGSFSYSLLKDGVYGPSVSFGSGGNAVSNCDMRTARSIVDWESVCCISDRKQSDPSSPSNRYVGLYRGGDVSLLSSYYLYQIDWMVPHTYRIVRDPVSSVSVYVDGGSTPVISAGYDVLTLPLNTLDFLSGLVPSGKFVAFGSFSSSEIARSSWYGISYSVGKMTVTDGIVPSRHFLNQANVVSSPEHLAAASPHLHRGTSSYSGGTPTDDYLFGPNSPPASTVLGEGTPPIQMTQNLESRGGFEVVETPVTSVSSVDFVNTRGNVRDNVVVRLDVPDRVLYEGIKFQSVPYGEPGLVSSVSDDENMDPRLFSGL